MELTIIQGEHRATLRSQRPDGFTDNELLNARTIGLNAGMVAGQVNRAWRRGPLMVHVNTGPPAWWYPRIRIGRSKVMVGWLRALVAVSWHG